MLSLPIVLPAANQLLIGLALETFLFKMSTLHRLYSCSKGIDRMQANIHQK